MHADIIQENNLKTHKLI